MPLDINRIKAICFDVDGTLSDTDDLYIQKILPLVKPLRWLTPRKEPSFLARRLIMNMETPGNNLYHLLDRFGMDAFAGRVYNRINRINHSIRPKASKKFMIVPGTVQALEAMKQRFPLAVVSAGSRSSIFGFLEAFSLVPHFKAIATSQTCEYTKPYPHPVLWAAHQMGVEPGECVMIGDTVVDIRAGRSAGAQTVGVLCGFGEEAELRNAGADLIVNSPLDLVDHLRLPVS
jgi:HAD superfamily hydrolase (TIGR01509 family)